MNKLTTTKVIRILTIASSALVVFAGGLAMLPIDSANLPMPPEWRPYLAGSAFIAAAVRIVVLPTLDAVIKGLNDASHLWILCLALLTFSLASCTSIPGELLGGAPGCKPLNQFGGIMTMTAPNGVQVFIDNQKSFKDFNWTVNSLGTGLIFANMQKAIEAGKRAVETTTITEGTKKAAIDSSTTLGLAAEETARMEIEAVAPAVVPVP